MKTLPPLITSVLLLAFAAESALAAATSTSSRSNTQHNTIIKNQSDEKACTDEGGTVSTDKDGNKICSLRVRRGNMPETNPPKP